MRKITVDEWHNIPDGTTIPNGYSAGYCTAPSEPGLYTLYEVADDMNRHAGWEWEKER